jgi:hypothetical protein
MSLEFDEEQQSYSSGNYESDQKNPVLVQFVINLGLAKDVKSANILLLVIGVIFLLISFYLFSRTFSSPANEVPEDLDGFPPFPSEQSS